MGLLPIASQVLLNWLDEELDGRGKTCVTVDVMQLIV